MVSADRSDKGDDPFDEGRPVVLARDDTPRGSVVLRRRRDADAGEVIELITNGTFVMDTLETSTERQLAQVALEAVGRPTPRTSPYAGHTPRAARLLHVVAAGLGLGFTVRELLGDARVGRVDTIEIEPAVASWVRDGLVPATAGVLADERVHTHVSDVRSWLPAQADESFDILLLDVDNGPGFLVHRANTEVYEPTFLATVKRALRPGGVLAVWSAARAGALRRRLERTYGACDEIRHPVTREGRHFDYYIYVAQRADR